MKTFHHDSVMDEEHLDPLCCCEYFDKDNERNHILACCCNCTDLDESFTNLISGQEILPRNKFGLIATMQDRLRIPWSGGAKQIAVDSILPVFILPLMILLSSISLWWTIFSFTTVIVFLTYISKFFIRNLPKTKFFFMWTLTSIIFLYFIFEFIVIPFLEILLEENIALSVIIGAFLFCLYLTKLKVSQSYETKDIESESGNLDKPNQLFNCSICQITIPDKDHHCLWFDCCIGKQNQCLFLLTLLFALAALLYSSNLTLTAVCHPFNVYRTILLPDDCSEVYQQFELGLAFVSAIYSLCLAFLLLLLMLHQVWLISIGLTGKEWRKLPLSSKCCLGLLTHRPYNRGFFRNWARVVCCSNNCYSAIQLY